MKKYFPPNEVLILSKSSKTSIDAEEYRQCYSDNIYQLKKIDEINEVHRKVFKQELADMAILKPQFVETPDEPITKLGEKVSDSEDEKDLNPPGQFDSSIENILLDVTCFERG